MAINSLASLCNESNFFASSAGPKAEILDRFGSAQMDFSIENSKKKCVVLDIEFKKDDNLDISGLISFIFMYCIANLLESLESCV